MPDDRQQLISLIKQLNEQQISALLHMVRVLLDRPEPPPPEPAPTPAPPPATSPPGPDPAPDVDSFIDDYLSADVDIGDDWAEKLKMDDG